jgi:hypothetical protein
MKLFHSTRLFYASSQEANWQMVKAPARFVECVLDAIIRVRRFPVVERLNVLTSVFQ